VFWFTLITPTLEREARTLPGLREFPSRGVANRVDVSLGDVPTPLVTAQLAAARSRRLRRFDPFAVDLFAPQRTPFRANKRPKHRRKKAPLFARRRAQVVYGESLGQALWR